MQAGSLRVGAFLSASNSFLPAALARFEQAHPGVEVDLDQPEEPGALRRLRSGDLDVAVVWRIPGFPGEAAGARHGFEELLLAKDPYRVVLSRNHRLARRRGVRLGDLAGERFSAPPAAEHVQPYRQLLERLWADGGIEPRVQEVADVTVARAMIAAGLSVGLLSELTMPEPRPDIALLPLRGMDPHRTVHATWLRDRRVPAVTRMVEYLAEAAQARLGR